MVVIRPRRRSSSSSTGATSSLLRSSTHLVRRRFHFSPHPRSHTMVNRRDIEASHGGHGGHAGPMAPPTGAQQFGHGAPGGYTFQYSNCTGRRKALLIGINYFGQRGQLRGCINDVKNLSTYLNQHFGYRREGRKSRSHVV